MPLSGKGLCDAEMTAPRLAPCSRTSQATAGCRDHSGAQRDAARRGDAGAERVLEHGPRATRVTADDDRRRLRAALAREQCGGTPQRERDIGVQDVAVGNAADAVRAEQLARHRRQSARRASASRTAGGAGLLETGLLALHLARVAGQEPGALERRAQLGSASQSARAMPWRRAPAWPLMPPPGARAHVEALGRARSATSGAATIVRRSARGKYSSSSRPLTVISPVPGSRITRATDVLRLPVP